MGQRQGFTTNVTGAESVPYYVVSKDIVKNSITVATTPRTINTETFVLSNQNSILNHLPKKCEAQFRYRQEPFRVQVEIDATGRAMLTLLEKNIEMPSIGQSCVFYQGDECLGGGVISEIL